MSEIIEEKNEETHENIDAEVQKNVIRRIITYQKSRYFSSSFSSSSSLCCESSSSSFSSSKRASLLELMKGGNSSLGRLFEMEHTCLATHLEDYSGSPVIKPLFLWGSDIDEASQEPFPWMALKRFDPADDILDRSAFGSNMESDFVKRTKKSRRLIRTKTFRSLPRFGKWWCRSFRFRLKLRRLRIMICGKNIKKPS